MDRTLVIAKPDAVERGLVGEIISRFERRGLRVVALEMRMIDEATAARHYEEHHGKPFYGDLMVFITAVPPCSWSSRDRRTPGRSCAR